MNKVKRRVAENGYSPFVILSYNKKTTDMGCLFWASRDLFNVNPEHVPGEWGQTGL